jgi:hypothetical protein
MTLPPWLGGAGDDSLGILGETRGVLSITVADWHQHKRMATLIFTCAAGRHSHSSNLSALIDFKRIGQLQTSTEE